MTTTVQTGGVQPALHRAIGWKDAFWVASGVPAWGPGSSLDNGVGRGPMIGFRTLGLGWLNDRLTMPKHQRKGARQ